MRLLLAIGLAVIAAGLAFAGVPNERPRHAAPAVRHASPKQKPPPLRPPQFVVVSFDGSGGERMWTYWRSVARRAHAHFTFFVSGAYLVDWAHHDQYVPPDRPRGNSSIGFAPDAAWIAGMRRQIALGYLDGNEVGT